MCRILKSNVALSKSHFDALRENILQAGTGELVSENVEMIAECTAPVMPITSATEVGNAEVASSPTRTDTNVPHSNTGQPEEDTGVARSNLGVHCSIVNRLLMSSKFLYIICSM